MKRLPIFSTALVTLAVAAMIALGLWQLLIRLPEKQAYIARLAANPAKPAIPFPRAPDDALLFRRTSADCLPPVSISRTGAGAAGFRLIATCGASAGATGVKVQLGTTRDPGFQPDWRGGRVSGWISHAPEGRPLIAALANPAPAGMLLVADTPAAGLNANERPDVSLIPNNHLAYAWQWFFFAGVAVVIYALAVRKRMLGGGYAPR